MLLWQASTITLWVGWVGLLVRTGWMGHILDWVEMVLDRPKDEVSRRDEWSASGLLLAIIWPLTLRWAGFIVLFHQWVPVVVDIVVLALVLYGPTIWRRLKRIAKAIGAKARAARDRLVASMPKGRAPIPA